MDKLLLIHPGALGDLVQALPAFEALRGGRPRDHLTLLVGRSWAELAREWRLFDEVIPLDLATAFHGRVPARLAQFARIAAGLRRRRFAAVGVFKPSPAYALLARASGAPQRVGVTRGIGHRLLTRPIAATEGQHHEDRYLRVAEALGAVHHRRARAHWASGPLEVPGAGADAPRRLVAIAPGGGRNVKEDEPRKRWAKERYASLGARLLDSCPDLHLLVLGTGRDAVEAGFMLDRLPADRVTSLVGKTDIAGARNAIAACELLITNDSGLLHLGATTTARCIGIFGPTPANVLCPRREGVRPLWNPARAEPCRSERTGETARCAEPCCIDRISVDDVLRMALSLLADGGPGPTRIPALGQDAVGR